MACAGLRGLHRALLRRLLVGWSSVAAGQTVPVDDYPLGTFQIGPRRSVGTITWARR